MSDQVIHYMPSSLKQELLPKCWCKTERQKRKGSVCKKTHREVRVFSLSVEGPKDKSVMLNKSMSIKCTLQQWCGTGSVWAYGLWKRMRAPRRQTPCDGSRFTQSWKDSGKALEVDQQWLNSLSLSLQKGCPVDYRPTFYTLENSPLT